MRANLLILNGRTPGDDKGKYFFGIDARGSSTIDYYVASARCMSAMKSLHVLDVARDVRSDHYPVQLHVACDELHSMCAPPTSSEPKIRYHRQKAEA